MLYEQMLDLTPGMRLERRLAERIAARLVIGLLLAGPICAIAAFMLASGVVHTLAGRICAAGIAAGARIRHGLEAVPAVRVMPR